MQLPPFTEWFQRFFKKQPSDALAILVVVSLPWSTSATAVLIALWLLSLLPIPILAVWNLLRSAVATAGGQSVFSWLIAAVRMLWASDLRQSATTIVGGLPILLWLTAGVAMFWADVSWPERMHGLGGFHKLLVIPLLLSLFRRADQTRNVFVGFIISCSVLLALSWLFVFWPGMAWASARFPGVPVKDYHAQSGEFIICALGVLHRALDALKHRHYGAAGCFFGWAALFLLNVLFVAISRTELVAIPILLVIFGMQRYGWKGAMLTIVAGVIVGAVVWLTSPYLRERLSGIPHEVALSEIGESERLAFYKKSIRFIEDAPLLGHGTGSIASLFRHSVQGTKGADAIATVNPHNQIFAVSIQLGLVGTIILLAMWAAHLELFVRAGSLGWIGTLLVAQIIISSQFNTHLFDFTQGWTYVFGVGIIGGMALQARQHGEVPAYRKLG